MITIRLACLSRQMRLQRCLSEDTHFLVSPVYIALKKNEFSMCVLSNKVGKRNTPRLGLNQCYFVNISESLPVRHFVCLYYLNMESSNEIDPLIKLKLCI